MTALELEMLYGRAVALSVEHSSLSASKLQWLLGTGYNTACRLIERLVAEGILLPPDGDEPGPAAPAARLPRPITPSSASATVQAQPLRIPE